MSSLDPYHEGSSPLHRLDPRVKLPLVIAFILAVALTPAGAWPVFILLFAVQLSAEILTGLPVSYFLKRALLATPFILAAAALPFTVPGPALAHLPFGWVITAPGLERFVSIALKSWISIQAALLLTATTPFQDLLLAMRNPGLGVGLPRLFVAVIGLMWRYIFVIGDEALRLLRARASRSGANASPQPGRRTGGSLLWRARVTGGMAGSLFLRSIERSDRIYLAMIARGYDGETRWLPQPALAARDRLGLAGGVLFLAVLTAFGLLFWG